MIKKVLHNLKSSMIIGKEVIEVAKTIDFNYAHKIKQDDLNFSKTIFNLIELNQVNSS